MATQVFAVVLTHAAAHALIDSSVQLERSARQVVCMDSLFKATPSQPKGPFYAPAALRSNITEGRKGVPLTLTVIVKVLFPPAFRPYSRVYSLPRYFEVIVRLGWLRWISDLPRSTARESS